MDNCKHENAINMQGGIGDYAHLFCNDCSENIYRNMTTGKLFKKEVIETAAEAVVKGEETLLNDIFQKLI